MSNKEKFEQLKNSASLLDTNELDAFYDTLEPVTLNEILGEWKGDQLKTGHAVVATLQAIRWYGKTFISQLEAKPLICKDADGNFYSDTTSMKGEASLWPIDFRGKVSTSMIYDGVPVLAHFRKVNSNTLVAIMDGKDVLDQGKHFYFFLERI